MFHVCKVAHDLCSNVSTSVPTECDDDAGLEVLQPAIARQAEQSQLCFEDCCQLLFMASAAAACIAAASQALHVSSAAAFSSVKLQGNYADKLQHICV